MNAERLQAQCFEFIARTAPADAAHVTHNVAAHLDRIEADGAAEVTLAGRKFTVRKQFLDDLKDTRARERIAALKKPLLIFHAPRDETVGIDNAKAIYEAAKHPKSFVSLDRADHLLPGGGASFNAWTYRAAGDPGSVASAFLQNRSDNDTPSNTPSLFPGWSVASII